MELYYKLLSERDTLYEVRFKAIEDLFKERDRLYISMFHASETAVVAALAAVKESTSSTFSSSEKAIVKAEDAQRTYNQGHNDLARKMDEQYKSMVPASEARLKWEAVDKDVAESRKDLAILRDSLAKEVTSLRTELMKEIAGLRESRSELGGKTSSTQQASDQRHWAVGVIVAIVLGLFSIGLTVVDLMYRAGKP